MGYFSNTGKKRVPQYTLPISQLKKADVESWLGEAGGGALLLFHCMWGQMPTFHQKKYLRSFDAIFDTQPTDGIHTEISFIWHAGGILYRKNWQKAAGKGEPLGQLVKWVAAHFNGNAHVICHSMGNRFFEGAVRTMPESKNAFKSLTLFSTDIDNSSLDEDFVQCQLAAKNLYVYTHHKDRFLWLSSALHGVKRLGRSGPEPAKPDIHVVDMTAHAKGLGNHTHLDKAWVREQLTVQFKNQGP